MSPEILKAPITRKAFWAAAFFYLIIGFEFFYMAGPFAVYFYSVYGPGLRFINESPALAWLSSLFLPHIAAQSTSLLLDLRNLIGGSLAFLGFVGFCLGAAQVYYHKLTRKSAVTGGVYALVRHPQYASLMLCGLGLLLLWPRYIVLLSFTAMIFVYYFLAKHEERECELKYGEPYTAYKARTSMFLPFRIPLWPKVAFLPQSGMTRYLTIFLLYGITSVMAVGGANILKTWSLNRLYGLYEKDAAYISVARADTETLRQIIRIALTNTEVRDRLEAGQQAGQGKFIHYILPAQWSVSEIPMNPVEGAVGGHYHPKGYDRGLQRIVFTKAELRTGSAAAGREILLGAVRTEPLLEVVVDLGKNRVVGTKGPPARKKYAGIPVPLY
jgi:protein-S-isoprenylcysteine O-methyltransferase Ste14